MRRACKYTSSFRYAGKDIPFNFWLVWREGVKPDTVVFLGAGQTGNITRWIAQASGPGELLLWMACHIGRHPTGRDTAVFSIDYVQAAFKAVLKTFGVSSMNVVAESQAAPAGVILTSSLPKAVQNLVLVRPLGFSARALGDSDLARLRTFRRRIMRTFMQFSQTILHDPRNGAIALIMLRAMLRESSLASFNKKYTVGISYDLIEDCRRVAGIQRRKGQSFTILLGEKDKMFPPQEILAALKEADVNDIVVETVSRVGHSSLAVRSSRTILQRAIDVIREDFAINHPILVQGNKEKK